MKRLFCVHTSSVVLSLLVVAMPTGAMAQASVAGHQHDAGSVAGAEPAAALIADNPLAGPLSRGVVVLPFRAEHIKILPVYGEAALGVAPRVGHLHITLDRASWHWVHATTEPVVIQGLPKGMHQMTLELADANHRVLQTQEISFSIP